MVKLKYNLYICNRKIGFVNIRGLSSSHKATEDQSDMMTADKERVSLEHDTTMCGDSKIMFLTKVSYSHELKGKGELDRL